MIIAADLVDQILSQEALRYVDEANAWLTQLAADFGVAAADIPSTLSYRAKRCGVLKLACLTALGQGGINQAAFDGQVQDVYMVKLKAYEKQLADVLDELSKLDFLDPGATVDPADQVANLTPRIGRA